MMLPHYELKSDESLTVFEFVSVGRKGEIPKIFQYSETNLKGFYNLGFGDKDLQTGDFKLYGQREGEWQEFERGVEYEAFLVKRRS